MTKIKKIYKTQAYDHMPRYIDCYDFLAFLEKHKLYAGDGSYKLSISFKIGKRRKLKKVCVNLYNSSTCSCCGPHYVAEIM